MQQIKFSRSESREFVRTLNKRVNNYFKDNNISKTGNWKLYLKSAAMFALLLVPFYFIMFTGINPYIKLPLWIVMGAGMAGVGMNVMHDGNHGTFSKYNWVNKLMGGTIYVLAGNVYNWQVQHNVLHHTFTNIDGHDEDLDAGRIIRFSQNAPWKKFHRFQHIYSVFLYGLLTINWAITTDFKQTKRYLERKLSYGKLPSAFEQWSTIAVSKIVYVFIWIVLPVAFTNLPWWMVVVGFFAMHYTAGLILSIVFQLAHVVEHASMPAPNEEGQMKNSWVTHQLFTTTNFDTNNSFVNWFTGGLNHQVEHHIFPNISHIHYSKIREIVKKTAAEFDLPYYEYKSTRDAIKSHFRYLKQLGVQPQLS